MVNLTEVVSLFFQTHSIKGKNIALAFSGGVDSSVLLDIVLKLKDKFDLKVWAIYVDHGIRDRAVMDNEVLSVRNKLSNLPLEGFEIQSIGHGVLERLKGEQNLSIEEISRDFRYKIIKDFQVKNSIDYILVAHHLDDDIETQIMRFFNFGSLNSLYGIPKINENILRPLLEVEKSQIYEYANSNNIDYVIDSGNFEDAFLRSKLRNRLIKEIENVFPNYKKSLLKLKQSIVKKELNYFKYEKILDCNYGFIKINEFLSIEDKDKKSVILNAYSNICKQSGVRPKSRVRLDNFEKHFLEIKNKTVSFNDFSIEIKDGIIFIFLSQILKDNGYFTIINETDRFYSVKNIKISILSKSITIDKCNPIVISNLKDNFDYDYRLPNFIKKLIPLLYYNSMPIMIVYSIIKSSVLKNKDIYLKYPCDLEIIYEQ